MVSRVFFPQIPNTNCYDHVTNVSSCQPICQVNYGRKRKFALSEFHVVMIFVPNFLHFIAILFYPSFPNKHPLGWVPLYTEYRHRFSSTLLNLIELGSIISNHNDIYLPDRLTWVLTQGWLFTFAYFKINKNQQSSSR